MELFKNRGHPSCIKSYRDITLQDLSPKDFGSFVRAAIMVAATNLSGSGQYGAGMHGCTTDLCHMHITQTFALARARKKSGGVVFIDLVNAFASVARRIVVPDLPQSEESWRMHLFNCGFSMEDADQIVEQALTVLRWQAMGASEHAIAVMRETHRRS